MILLLFYYIANYFTSNGITEAVLYHLKYGLKGAGFHEYANLIITTSLSTAVLLISQIVIYFVKLKKGKGDRHAIYLAIICIFISLLLNPSIIDIYELEVKQAVTSATDNARQNSAQTIKPPSFNDYYRTPYIERVGKPKNLIYIYLESLEETYSNIDIFPDLTPGLNKLRERTVYFSNIGQTSGADYTMGGVVSSQCGIPIISASHGNSMSGMDEFLPQAICIGDLLK